MGDDRSYKNEDVRAIIDRALERQAQEALSHEDLLAVGAEVGLSRAAVERAALEVEQARSDAEARALVIATRRRGLAAHAISFFALNGLLFAINFLTTPGQWWVLFPLFGWGLALVLHAAFGLSSRVPPGRLNRAKRRIERRRAGAGALHARVVLPNERVRLNADASAARELDEGTSEPPKAEPRTAR
jgi:hypothetical protein